MFSSNEKISGRQAFRLLVFDLLGLGTLLNPGCGRRVLRAGRHFLHYCGNSAWTFIFTPSGVCSGGYAGQLCRIYGKNVRDIFPERPYRRDIFCI